ncbi:MAG TPA: protocatechuate 3,4-dioxygenase subunit alpha [Actinomycetota bacterium]|nr:protocatechuate 3,4-dioxygenase subunit alpha [Actinomycetota bacterium]
MSSHELTPAQTVGPFFAPLLREGWNTVTGTTSSRIRIEGQVFDGDGSPVPDAMLEIWHADAGGGYAHPADAWDPSRGDAGGFGRAGTDEAGRFWFETTKPGPVPHPSGAMQAPHAVVHVFARGLLDYLTTRLYFSDDDLAGDPVLSSVPEDRRGSLIAQRTDSGAGVVYRFDVVLQGEGETVFFEP